MKTRYFFLIILLTVFAFPQENQEVKSLEELLTNKADEITKEEIANNPEMIPAPVIKKAPAKEEIAKAEAFTFETIHYQMLFLLNASLVAALVVIIRRKKIELAKLKNSDLKENIKNLREEKIRIRPDKKLREIRKSLFSKKITPDSNGLQITEMARKLSISKGEVHLAAKLNLLYEQNK